MKFSESPALKIDSLFTIRNAVVGEVNRKGSTCSVIGSAFVTASLLAVSVSRLLCPFDLGHYEARVRSPALFLADGVSPYDSAMKGARSVVGRLVLPPVPSYDGSIVL